MVPRPKAPQPEAPASRTRTRIVAGGLSFPRLPFTAWTIIGIDLSLSRTGFAVMTVEGTEAQWAGIGSITPKDVKEETWARAEAIGVYLRGMLLATQVPGVPTVVAIEFPDPNNSYLMGLNQVIQTVLWSTDEDGAPAGPGRDLFRFAINATTLRAALRLSGSDTKADNLALAYEYVDKKAYPHLDSDSCDAVLLAMMARHAVMVLGGHEDLVPAKPLTALCSDAVTRKVKVNETTGDSKITKETPKGLLHNPLTWTKIEAPRVVNLRVSDARTTARRNSPPTTIYL